LWAKRIARTAPLRFSSPRRAAQAAGSVQPLGTHIPQIQLFEKHLSILLLSVEEFGTREARKAGSIRQPYPIVSRAGLGKTPISWTRFDTNRAIIKASFGIAIPSVMAPGEERGCSISNSIRDIVHAEQLKYNFFCMSDEDTVTLDISYSVVRLTMRFNATLLAYGSGFLYTRHGNSYIITAWHNLSGRHSWTLTGMHTQGGLPNNLIAVMPCLVINNQTGGLYTRSPVRFNFDDGVNTTYLVHATGWPRVDVAVIPFDPGSDLPHEIYLSDGTTRRFARPLRFKQDDGTFGDIVSLSSDPISLELPDGWQFRHTVGDDLFLLGFPFGIVDYQVIPIWKRGPIATEPSHDWNGQKTFLVDAASRKGMSGGPALYYSKTGVVPVEPGSYLSVGRPLHIHQGVYVGRMGDSEFEAQVGVVWKKSVIDEIIDRGLPGHSTHDLEISLAEVEGVIRENWPKDIDLKLYTEIIHRCGVSPTTS
jgi:hypothetical protein